RVEATTPVSDASNPDIPGWQDFAKSAEEAGIDSLLISFSRAEPDPMLLACALGQETRKLKFIVAFRSGLMQPAAFVQQANTLSGLIGGRVSLNTVAGSSSAEQKGYGDFLAHDDRYARAGEFLAACNAFWGGDGPVDFEGRHYQVEGGTIFTRFQSADRQAPEMYVSGHSDAAQDLAAQRGSCWLRVIDTPVALEKCVRAMRARGREVCLRLCIVCRATREEAVSVIDGLMNDEELNRIEPRFPVRDDSQMYREAADPENSAWRGERIWTGFTPRFGPVWTTLVGTPDELAASFLDYKRIGVSQFIISGWPETEEVQIFGREVVPRVRALEQLEKAA
ncbi:MAG: LLM class flavin-dependent oxidoreductase, partial [Pseudomonadota bacterium]